MNKEQTGIHIIERLRKNGFEAYFAGGCVRDRLRGALPKDYDIATSATPDEVRNLFAKTVPVGAEFGVVLVVESAVPFEVVTFRKEGGYQDGRRPDFVSFTNVKEDAVRRDFTVNGLYWDPLTDTVHDFIGGKNDLAKKIIRTIGDPNERFQEDHLRILRAIRFAVQLDFEIEQQTFDAIKTMYQLVARVSQERIRDEFTKILTSHKPARGISLLDEIGIMDIILPELKALKGLAQPVEYHPEGDVFRHTLMLMEGLNHAPIELALACLLHDIAKPQTFEQAEDRIRFHGHDKLGAEMARDICKRLTFSNDQTNLICSLVAEHLRFKDVFQMRVSTLKRFFSLDRFDLHLELHRLDCLASHRNLDAYDFCIKKLDEYSKLPPPPSRLVTGHDLMMMGLSPGPVFAKILRTVEDAVLEGEVNSRDDALQLVTQIIKEKRFNG